MKGIAIGTAILWATVAMGQTTRPNTAPLIIAQLKEENAKLKAENQELRRQLGKAEMAIVDAADFSSLQALVKVIPRKLLSTTTEVQNRERRDWVERNLAGKTIAIDGELKEAKIDEIGRITVSLESPDYVTPMRRETVAKFVGTEIQRKAIAQIDPGQQVHIIGKITGLASIEGMFLNPGDQKPRQGWSLFIDIDECQLAK